MNTGKAIYRLLTDNSTVNGLVSGRVYQTRLPQSCSYPAIMIQKISDVPFKDNDGSDLWRARMQVNSYATTQAAVQQLAVAVQAALDWTLQTNVGGVNVVEITLEDENDFTEDYAEFDGLFHVAQDYFVTYQKMYS